MGEKAAVAPLMVFVYTQIALNELYNDCTDDEYACTLNMKNAAIKADSIYLKNKVKLSEIHIDFLQTLSFISFSSKVLVTSENNNETSIAPTTVISPTREALRKTFNEFNLDFIRK